MLNFSGLAKAPAMKFSVLLKPTAMSKKKLGKVRAEYETVVEANSKEEAVFAARKDAEANGFTGYAITKIKEIKKQ